MAADGKFYKTQAADLEGVFRIIESIPSKKAEPVRQWLAEVGAQRVDQMIDPELTFQMAVEDYRRQGYSDRWINERMRGIVPVLYQREPARWQEGEARHSGHLQGGHPHRPCKNRQGVQCEYQRQGNEDTLHACVVRELHHHQPCQGTPRGYQGCGA